MISWKMAKEELPDKDMAVIIKYPSGLIVSGFYLKKQDRFYYMCHCGIAHYTESRDVEKWCLYQDIK